MARQQFAADESRIFERAANPHQWLLSADRLHEQAVVLYERRGRGALTELNGDGLIIGSWDATNKAAFLLCAFALENAIKAFLVYEHPNWISDGYLHDEICSHKLVTLSEKSTLMPNKSRNRWVLAAFEEGNESWMRYPCPRRASALSIEADFNLKLWTAYGRVMRGYGTKLTRLLREGWKGPHDFAGHWKLQGELLGHVIPSGPRLRSTME